MIYQKGTHFDCPFCQSSHTTEYCTGTYLCKDCDHVFDINDVILEPIRHKLSAVLSGRYATEENPMPCDITIGEWDAQGLSTLELPHLVSIFETQDGVIYFNIDGLSEPIEFDSMPLEDLVIIADEINQ